jgi:hypothetical protein
MLVAVRIHAHGADHDVVAKHHAIDVTWIMHRVRLRAALTRCD